MRLFEEGGRQPGQRSNSKVKRLAKTLEIGIQVSIKKYLWSTERGGGNEEDQGSKHSSKFESKGSGRKPIKPGSVTKPKPARPSSPAK